MHDCDKHGVGLQYTIPKDVFALDSLLDPCWLSILEGDDIEVPWANAAAKSELGLEASEEVQDAKGKPVTSILEGQLRKCHESASATQGCPKESATRHASTQQTFLTRHSGPVAYECSLSPVCVSLSKGKSKANAMLVIARRVGEAITAPGSRPKMPLQLGQVPGTAQILPEAPSGAQADQKTLDIAQGNTKVSLPTSEVSTAVSNQAEDCVYSPVGGSTSHLGSDSCSSPGFSSSPLASGLSSPIERATHLDAVSFERRRRSSCDVPVRQVSDQFSRPKCRGDFRSGAVVGAVCKEASAHALEQILAGRDDAETFVSARRELAAAPSPLPNVEEGAGALPRYSDLRGGIWEVLVIDADEQGKGRVLTALRGDGFVATSCPSGTAALDLVNSRGHIPDLVVLASDADAASLAVCRTLRDTYTATLPVILISSDQSEDAVVRGFEAGCNDFVRKPFHKEEVLARVRTQLRLRKALQTEVEVSRSQELLSRMLPTHILNRLKGGETGMISESHESVTILFSDICGFTTISGTYSNADVMCMLDEMFNAFDALTIKHGVYKVQTIGDAYFVAAGHDEETKYDHPQRVLAFAQDALRAIGKIMLPDGSAPLRIRVGMHTGPAYAGVLGTKGPRYCFFGDTVNIASRMEAHGFAGCIHVSAATEALLSDACDWIHCGERSIKGKGMMNTYIARFGQWQHAVLARQRQVMNQDGSVELWPGAVPFPHTRRPSQHALPPPHPHSSFDTDEELYGVGSGGAHAVFKCASSSPGAEGDLHRVFIHALASSACASPRRGSACATPISSHATPRRGSSFGRTSSLDRASSFERTSSLPTPLAHDEHSQCHHAPSVDVATLRHHAGGPLVSLTESPDHRSDLWQPLSPESGVTAETSGSPLCEVLDACWPIQRSESSGAASQGQEPNGMRDETDLVQDGPAAKEQDGDEGPGSLGGEEVGMLLGYLGLQHLAAPLDAGGLDRVEVLAQQDEDALEGLGISEQPTRQRILDAAKIIQALVDLSLSRKESDHANAPEE